MLEISELKAKKLPELQDIAQKLNRVYHMDETEKYELSTKAIKYVKQEFSVETITKKLKEILFKLKKPIPPKEDPKNPYVPAPKRDLANLADGEPDPSIMNYVTEQGFFLDGQGKAYMQGGGKFQDAGEYNPDIHGLPVPLTQQMQINPDVANITPKDFSPPPFRYFPHIRIPTIKDTEMKHMKNFIEAMGGDTKGLTKRNNPMKVYG